MSRVPEATCNEAFHGRPSSLRGVGIGGADGSWRLGQLPCQLSGRVRGSARADIFLLAPRLPRVRRRSASTPTSSGHCSSSLWCHSAVQQRGIARNTMATICLDRQIFYTPLVAANPKPTSRSLLAQHPFTPSTWRPVAGTGPRRRWCPAARSAPTRATRRRSRSSRRRTVTCRRRRRAAWRRPCRRCRRRSGGGAAAAG